MSATRWRPRPRFPRQLEQIAAVVEQLPARFGLDSARIALAGDSAGAHLALAVSLGLRDRGGARPAALLLYYGSYGLRDSASRRLYGGPWDGLTEAELAFYRQCYLRGPDDARDPRYDLLAADLAGTPPCFIAACALDPLQDDSRALAALLEEHGTPVELRVYDGVLHGFLHLSRMVDLSLRAIEDGARFLRGWLDGPGTAAAGSTYQVVAGANAREVSRNRRVGLSWVVLPRGRGCGGGRSSLRPGPRPWRPRRSRGENGRRLRSLSRCRPPAARR